MKSIPLEDVRELVEALKYCAVEPEALHPLNNRQCAVAKNALSDFKRKHGEI